MSKKTSSSGIGFTGALTLLFVYLKLTKQIDWSWVWVLSPLWIVVAFVVAVIVICFVIAWIHVNWEERQLNKELERLLKEKRNLDAALKNQRNG